ncbi:MAG TPA: glycosyltransferase [Candidatus Limnocylindria bacterium]
MAPPSPRGNAHSWLYAGVPPGGSSGGSLRAAHLPRELIARTGGAVIAAYGRRGIPVLAAATALRSRLWSGGLNVYSARLLPSPALRLLSRGVRGWVLDLHDHPRLQSEALGVPLSARLRAELDDLVQRNVEAFGRLAVPSASFAELCALPAERVVVASNGTDTDHIRPGPWGTEPTVGMVSGAVPGRGIELLVDAVQRLRSEYPGVVLRLALAATGPASRRYLDELAASLEPTGWVRVQRLPYEQLPAFLARCQVMVIPHPPGAYMDVATPVKLFDGMAAGRPTVVTPRHETAAIVRRNDAGIVTAGDGADDLAQAIGSLLRSDAERRRLGANARRAAESGYDWRVISGALADAVLGPRASEAQNASR